MKLSIRQDHRSPVHHASNDLWEGAADSLDVHAVAAMPDVQVHHRQAFGLQRSHGNRRRSPTKQTTARLTVLIDPDKKAFEMLCAAQDVTPS
jgi:hypothetical protein